jgi:hypothetical protein
MSSNTMSAEDKRARKNELARIRRANSKNLTVEIEEAEPTPEPPPEPRIPTPEPEPSPEEIAQQRKEAIAEKRRQSLIIARSKITPKNVIRKDAIDKVNKKDIELNDAKREAEEIKRIAREEAEATKKKAAEDVEVMKSLVKTKIISDADTHKRSKSVAPKKRVLNKSQSYTLEPPPQPQQALPQQPPPQQPQARPDLIQMSYTEQLRQKLRQEQFQRLMSDTFG